MNNNSPSSHSNLKSPNDQQESNHKESKQQQLQEQTGLAYEDIRKNLSPFIQANVNFIAGLFSGSVQAAALNPWDRALYLCVINHRPFLTWDNFRSPYQGFLQSAVQRTISSGLYFVLQAHVQVMVQDLTHKDPTKEKARGNLLAPTLVGMIAGMMNGMILNQLASVKYHAWNQRENLSFWEAAAQMYKNGGVGVFFKGAHVTGLRDMIFGCVYEVGRVWALPPLKNITGFRAKTPEQRAQTSISPKFLANMFAAFLATVASGPFNYARSIKYSTPANEQAPSMRQVLGALWRETGEQKGFWARYTYAQQRLRIGWGTARVGVGMALGQELFDWAKKQMEIKADVKLKKKK